MTTKDKWVTVRVDNETSEKLKRIAKETNRSVGSVIRLLVKMARVENASLIDDLIFDDSMFREESK